MKRREFMMLGAAGAVVPGFAGVQKKVDMIVKHDAPPRNRRPYSNVDWSKVQRVKTTSHGHCISQKMLDVYLARGFGLLTISNYYPSAPYVPAAEMTHGYYRMHHDHPVMVKGKRTDGPFDWNKIIGGWKDQLDEKAASGYPLREGGKMFKQLPEGVLEAPNAEHHNFKLENGKGAGVHLCAPGSAFASGTFDAHDVYKTHSHGYNFGSGEFWGTAVDRMIAGLIYPDGGGVTINHPSWSKVNREFVLTMLDWDPRVLGMEVIEGGGTHSENYWDWALATGRQCFGFFVPDWTLNKKIFGVNVLCVQEKSVQACLQAYRQGNFYGAAIGFDALAFTRIAFDGKRLVANTDKPARFEVITARGVVKEEKGTEVTWDVVPNGFAAGPRVDVFARVKAYAVDGSDEELFSQPFMLY